MRKIMCLLMVRKSVSLEILEECSRHSFLVEPRSQEVLVDLSSFQKIGGIIESIGAAISNQDKAEIGIASSPLLAITAAHFHRHLSGNSKCHRLFQSHGLPVIQVLPGQEADFLKDLPLEEFLPLTEREQKLLKRMGYDRVGELVNLSTERLSRILKRDAAILGQNCRGIDYSSVKGLYPPDSISYAFTFPGGCSDLLQMQEIIKAISLDLVQELQRRQAACNQVWAELLIPNGCRSWERTLTRACFESTYLENIINSLIQIEPGQMAAEEIRVALKGLQRVEMHMPDLFTWRREARINQLMHIKDTVYDLQQKYPDCIQIGVIPERREEVLSLWDPWRLNLPGVKKYEN